MRRRIKNTTDALPLLKSIANAQQEHFVVISIDPRNRLIRKRMVFVGTLSAVVIHPREIFVGAIEDRAAAIIIAHNHTVDDPTPSEEDLEVTKQLIVVGKIIGIDVIDHIVVAGDQHFSFRSENLLDLAVS